MKILRDFRRLVEALECGARALTDALEILRERPDESRLADLELSRSKWEAEMEAVLLKAEGKLQAANNAEARERTMRKTYEKFIDPFDPEGDEAPEGIAPGYAARGEEEGLQPLHLGMEDADPTGRKVVPLNAKWGR